MKKYYQSIVICAFGIFLSQNAQAQCVPNNNPSFGTVTPGGTTAQNLVAPNPGNTVSYVDRDKNGTRTANLGTYATYLLPSYLSYNNATVEYTFSSNYCTSVGGCNPNDANYHTYVIITDEANKVLKQGDAPLKVLNSELGGAYTALDQPCKIRVHYRTTDNNCIIYTGSSAGNYYTLYLTAKSCPTPITTFRDADGDGLGDRSNTKTACDSPAPGYVLNFDDCDDSNASIKQRKWFRDADNDGFGDVKVTNVECGQSQGWVSDSTDCNDADVLVNPANKWFEDLDEDGFGDKNNFRRACVQPAATVADSTDCNDASANDTQVFDWYPDADGDGYGKIGTIPSFTSCKNPNFRLEGGALAKNNKDCDDNNPNINPEATEILNNNIDENCDGAININNSLDFDQSNGVTVPHSPSLSITLNCTLEAWIKPTRGAYGTIVSKNNGNDYEFGIDDGNLYFKRGASLRKYNSKTFNFNEWQHVAVSVDAQKITFYLNGVPDEILTPVPQAADAGNLVIGVDSEGSPFPGIIDELRIWNTTRTAQQIINTMSKSLISSAKTGLVAYYTFDQGNPGKNNTLFTILDDLSGNENIGTLNNFILNGPTSNFVSGAPDFYIAPTIITDVQNESLASSIRIYPNPNNGTFSISSSSELGNVSVYNSLGVVVYQNTISAKQLNIELPSKEAGIYFVKVGNRMTKLIKE